MVREKDRLDGKQGNYTYEDCLDFLEEPGYCYEILKGALINKETFSFSLTSAGCLMEAVVRGYINPSRV